MSHKSPAYNLPIVNLFLNTENHQLSLSKILKLITTALHDFRVEIRYISYLLDNLLEIIKELCC